MSFYFREKPKFGDKLRGRSSDELLQEIKQQFDEDSKSFFEPTSNNRSAGRDPFERHTVFPRVSRTHPGFPFDGEGFGKRSDIRAHLDQLAARHPEFADHLLGPAWGDIPFHGSLRHRNRGSGSGSGSGSGNYVNNNYQGYSDEDARSQASGSSAASGASAVSSHSEAEGSQNHRNHPNHSNHPNDQNHQNHRYYQNNHNQQDREKSRDRSDSKHQEPTGRTQIPQYGFRNTVDIGQHQHNMENPDRGYRGQRSMSAPPENRQQSHEQQPKECFHNCQQQSQPQGQRYVSRIDITPQQPQPQPQQQQPQPQQPQPQSQPQSQQQANVRHIPIFVEGRDEPVLPRSFDEPFRREPSPTQFHTMPHFQRSSPFGQSSFARSHQWSPHFQDPFYTTQATYEQPSRKQQQSDGYQHPRQQQQPYEKHQHHPQDQPQQQQQHHHHPQQQQQQQQQQEPPTTKSKPIVPKDPLERVAMVQREVDSLAEQVKQYKGNSRKDKEYIYLDEMLTRELIKLDDIETEGRENVRQARKNAIKTIQETIGLLESRAPLASSQPATPQEITDENPAIPTLVPQPESMDVDWKPEERDRANEPIPLPPCPSAPTNKPADTVEEKKPDVEQQSSNSTGSAGEHASAESMDTTTGTSVAEGTGQEKEIFEKPAEQTPMDVQENSEQPNLESKRTVVPEGSTQPQDNVSDEKKTTENDSSSRTSDVPGEEKPSDKDATIIESDNAVQQQKTIAQQAPADNSEKMVVDETVKQPSKTTKKGKKSKKQPAVVPVSDTPIPLPPPQNIETNAK